MKGRTALEGLSGNGNARLATEAGSSRASHSDRLGDVFDRLLAQILEIQIDLALDLCVHGPGDADAAGLRQGFQPRGDVHAVAVDVVAIDDYVAQVDADAKDYGAIFGLVLIFRRHGTLDVDRALDSVNHAGELDQRAIAHQLNDASVVLCNLGINDVVAGGLEIGKGSGLILAHESAVADNVGCEDRGEPTFHCTSPSTGRLPT